MSNSMQKNFEIAAELAPVATVKIQAMVRCLRDNTDTAIDLRDPEQGGNTIYFDLVSGDLVDVDDCCGLRDVTRTDDRLDA